jgi:hypothetical protein
MASRVAAHRPSDAAASVTAWYHPVAASADDVGSALIATFPQGPPPTGAAVPASAQLTFTHAAQSKDATKKRVRATSDAVAYEGRNFGDGSLPKSVTRCVRPSAVRSPLPARCRLVDAAAYPCACSASLVGAWHVCVCICACLCGRVQVPDRGA